MKQRSPWGWIPTLYTAEGIPYVIVMSVATVMYERMGLTNAQIALYTSWLYLPWVIKPFWSPIVDLLRNKRWWIVAMQLIIGAALGGLAFSMQLPYFLQCSLAMLWLMAFSSATHDIAADGYYMLMLDEHNQTKYVGLRNTFYRLAVVFVNAGLAKLADKLENYFNMSVVYTWTLVFYGLAGLFICIWLYHSRVMPRSDEDVATQKKASDIARELKSMFITFFSKFELKDTIFAMVFLLLYRFPEALLNTMTKTFLMRPSTEGGLGLTLGEYGFAQGFVGIIGLLLGGIIGGVLVSRDGMKKWLWPMVCAITLPDVVYIYLSYTLNSNIWLVSSCLFVEQFGYGLGFTVLTLYMLYYCKGKFQTSHYSICTGISYLGLMLPGMVSGYIKDIVGYQTFFIIVMACCLITFIVTAFLKIDPDFGKKK